MKLTNYIKDAIVGSVMNDTPESFSYDNYVDSAMKIAVSKLPDAIMEIYNNKELRGFIANTHYHGIYIPISSGASIPEIDELKKKYEASRKERQSLRSHVKNVVYQFSTDKQMISHIPELAKYLPKVEEKKQNLPTDNMIAELVKAGWPKQTKGE